MLFAEIGQSRLSCGPCRLRSDATPAPVHPPTWTAILSLLRACVGTVLARPVVDRSTAGGIVVRYCGDGAAVAFHTPRPSRKPILAPLGPRRGAPPSVTSCRRTQP